MHTIQQSQIQTQKRGPAGSLDGSQWLWPRQAGESTARPMIPLDFMLSSRSWEQDLTHSKSEPGLPNSVTFVLLSPLCGENKG